MAAKQDSTKKVTIELSAQERTALRTAPDALSDVAAATIIKSDDPEARTRAK